MEMFLPRHRDVRPSACPWRTQQRLTPWPLQMTSERDKRVNEVAQLNAKLKKALDDPKAKAEVVDDVLREAQKEKIADAAHKTTN